MNAVATITPASLAAPGGQLDLSLPEAHTFEEWSMVGRRLCASAKVISWMIGDWLIAGVEKHGEKARDEANAIFRSDTGRFGPIMDTCRRFGANRRHMDLSFGHHQAVMAIRDDAEADALLEAAERQRLTVAMVKAQVRVVADKQATMLPEDDPVDAMSRLISQAWNRASVAAREDFFALAEVANFGEIDL